MSEARHPSFRILHAIFGIEIEQRGVFNPIGALGSSHKKQAVTAKILFMKESIHGVSAGQTTAMGGSEAKKGEIGVRMGGLNLL